MRIAIVHEYLVKMGGAEKVLESLLDIYPNADVFTIFYRPERLSPKLQRASVRTSYLQLVPLASRRYDLFFWAMPEAVESWDLSGYDLVISNCHSFAKGAKVLPESLNICYMHTPTRYFWQNPASHVEGSSYHPILKKIIPYIINQMRSWDLQAAQKPTHIIANSKNIAKRIKKIYNRDSTVIYPPVKMLEKSKRNRGYFLIVSRLEPHKKVNIAVQAFSRIGLPLFIVGDGSQKEKLQLSAAKNVRFLGRVDDKRLPEIYQNAKAFIFPQEEDFGITAIEAQSASKPVIAYKAGGALETVLDQKTGILFPKQSAESLIQAVKTFEENFTQFNPDRIRDWAFKFNEKNFKMQFKKYIDQKLKSWGERAKV